MRLPPAASPRTDDFRSILVICTRQIGDVLLTTPLIRAAKERWPAARIDVLGFAGTLGMLEGNPDVGERIEVQPGSGWWDSLGLIRRLWRRYDLALVAQRSDRAFLYGWVAARRRVALIMGIAYGERWKVRRCVHAVPVSAEVRHTAVEKLALLSPWLPCEAPEASCIDVVAPRADPLPEDLASALRRRYVVVHAPSAARYKQWPPQHFRALVSGLLSDGMQVVLSGSAAATDQACIAQVRDAGVPPNVLDVSGRLSLSQLGTLLRGAALYIGPDTSITHLAAACGVPVVALFGPTPPQAWGPWPQHHRAATPWVASGAVQHVQTITLMQGPGACVPCGAAGCERHDNSRSDCLEALAPSAVIEQARRLLAAQAQSAAVSGSV